MKQYQLAFIILICALCPAFCQDSLNIQQLATLFDEEYVAFDLAYSDNIIYLCSATYGIAIIDVADPSDPMLISSYHADEPLDVTVNDSIIYIADGESGFLRVVNVSDLNNPELIGQYDAGNSVQTVVLQDELLFLAALQSGVRVLDVSDPSDPHEIASYYYNVPTIELGVFGNLLFVTEASGHIRILDISDIENPEVIDRIPVTFTTPVVDYQDGILYVPNGFSGLAVYEIGDDGVIRSVSHFNVGDFAVCVALDDSAHFAYLTDSEAGIKVLDVSDLDNIRLVGYYDTPGSAEYLKLGEDGLIFVGDLSNFGVYRFTPPEEGSVPEEVLPTCFTLYPAYPNPFNSAVTLRYEIPASMSVGMQIFDSRGALVTALPTALQSAGDHRFIWEPSGLAGGTYLLKFTAAGKSHTARLILLK